MNFSYSTRTLPSTELDVAAASVMSVEIRTLDFWQLCMCKSQQSLRILPGFY